MNLGTILTNLAAAVSAVAALVGIYHWWQKRTEKRKEEELKEEHHSWTEEIVKTHRRTGHPVRVHLHEREHLTWAVDNRRLRVVEEFEGGWMVVENTKLGDGPRVAAAS